MMDQYAAEVLLNKPGIDHNLDFMTFAANVAVQENTATYRSRYDASIAVILESVNHGDGLDGLSVRLQMPVKEQVTPHVQSVVRFKDAMLDDVGEDFLKSLGYAVNVVGMGVIDDGYDDEPGRERPVDVLPVEEKPAPDTLIVAGRVPEPSIDVVDVTVDLSDSDAASPKDGDAIWTQSILLSKGDVRWSIVHYSNTDGSNVDFILNIANTDTISDEVKQHLQKMMEFYGLEEGALSQLDENMNVMQAVALVPEKGEYDFPSTMKAELGWLQENGIIAGITEQDIANIASVTKQEAAGWNSRIAYSEGRWFPYYETNDARLIFEDADAPTVGVPEDMISFPTASVSPNSKSITQWGRIKSGS